MCNAVSLHQALASSEGARVQFWRVLADPTKFCTCLCMLLCMLLLNLCIDYHIQWTNAFYEATVYFSEVPSFRHALGDLVLISI